MARKVRSIRTSEFKAKVALAAIHGQQTTAQLATLHGVHPIQITQWKKQLLAGAAGVFATGVKADSSQATLVTELFERIGRLEMELEWLKKKTYRPRLRCAGACWNQSMRRSVCDDSATCSACRGARRTTPRSPRASGTWRSCGRSMRCIWTTRATVLGASRRRCRTAVGV